MLRVRRAIAAVGYVTGLALVLIGAASAFAGGLRATVFGIAISVTTWRFLRFVALAIAVALACDPERATRWERLSSHRRLFLGAGLAAAAAYLVAFKIAQHAAFGTGAYDLTMYESALSNTLHGRFLYAFGVGRSYFSHHFNPVLLTLLPFYALAPSAVTLVAGEALVVAGACTPLYLGSRARGLGPAAAALVVVAFFFNDFLWRSFIFDFHYELFLPLTLFAADWALARRRWVAFYLCLAATLCIKEDMALVGLALAGFVLTARRESPADDIRAGESPVGRRLWPHALATAALSIGWAVIAMKVIIPLANPERRDASEFIGRWSHLGTTLGAVAWNLASHPTYVLGLVFSRPMRELLSSLAWIPVFHPLAVVFALPAAILHMSANYPYEATLQVYYGLPAAMVLLLGVPRVIARVERRWGGPAAMAAGALAAFWYPCAQFVPRVTDADRAMAREIAAFPESATVCAQTSIVPHLPYSDRIAMFPDCTNSPEYYLLQTGECFALADCRWPLDRERYLAEVTRLLGRDDLGVAAEHDGFLVLRRGADRGRNAAAARSLLGPGAN